MSCPVTGANAGTAIVGGGILGLALALRLAERGERVTIFERDSEFGGLASAWNLGDVVWDRHYHVTLFSDTNTRRLLGALGLEAEMRWKAVGTGFYTGGRFAPMNGALDFLRFPPLGLFDKLRLGSTIVSASRIKDGLPLESIPVEDWLVRRSGRRTFEKIWRPLLVAKLGDRYRDASAAFIWAIIVRLYAARRAGLGAERFGYVPGGYARVLAALERRLRDLGVEMISCADVTRVGSAPLSGESVARSDGLPEATGPSAPAIGHEPARRIQVAIDGREQRDFASAIVTVAAPVIARLAPELTDAERETLTSKIYGGIVCASLLIDEPLGPYYVTNLTDEWVPFSAVIDMANVVNRTEWNGAAIVYLPKYVRPDDPLFAESDEAIEARFLAALERMYPNFSRERVRAFRVSRVRRVFPIATLHYSRTLPPVATSVPGLYLLDSAHIVNGTLNVNETLGLVERGLAALDAAPARVRAQ